MAWTTRCYLTFGLLVLTVACGDWDRPEPLAQDDPPTGQAGVVVIETSPDSIPEWTVGDRITRAEVGEDSPGSAPYLVSVRDGKWRSDGSFVVLDGQTNLHLFNADGTFSTELGRLGEGPGEFVSIGSLSVGSGDTIYVYDDQRHVVNIFGLDGEFVRSQRIAMPDGTLGRAQVLKIDGGWIHLASDLEGVDLAETLRAMRPGDVQTLNSTAVVSRLNEDGESVGAVRFSGASETLTGELSIRRPLAGAPLVATRGKAIVYASAKVAEFHQSDHHLSPVRRVEWPKADAPYPEAELDSIIALAESYVPDPRMIDLMFTGLARPSIRPFAQRIRVDLSCRIWVSRFEPILQNRPEREWIIFETDGQPAGSLKDIEGSVTILDARGNQVLITRIDPTEGIPLVEVRELVGAEVRSDKESETCRWT